MKFSRIWWRAYQRRRGIRYLRKKGNQTYIPKKDVTEFGLATLTHTHEESDNVAIVVANLDVRNDDEETCEPEPDTEDDILELFPCVVTIVQPTPGPIPIVSKKKQATITDFFGRK